MRAIAADPQLEIVVVSYAVIGHMWGWPHTRIVPDEKARAAIWRSYVDLLAFLQTSGKRVVLVLCGGNIDVTVLSRIIDRGLRVDGRLCRVVAQITDRPGSLAKLLNVIAASGASIKEVSHDRHFGPADVARVSVSCVVETQGFDHIDRLMRALRESGIEAVDDASVR